MTIIKSYKLDSILKELGSFVIAFSGGVDSSFLLHRSYRLRKASVIGVTIRTPYIPDREINQAISFRRYTVLNIRYWMYHFLK